MTILQDAPQEKVSSGQRERRAERRRRVESDRPTRSAAAKRALERRRRRVEADAPVRQSRTRTSTAPRTSLREQLRHIPFVVPVILILVFGLGLSLWLSTRAAQDSYELGVQRKTNQSLNDQVDALKRDYESGDSAPELAYKAAQLGMIPAQNPARMVVEAGKRPRVVGTPTPATGVPMPPLNKRTTPEPTATIDPRQVDDSIGLGGPSGQPSGTQNPSVPTPSATTPSATTPSAATPSATTPSAPTPSPTPSVDDSVVPSTDPIPSPGATP